MKNMTNIWRKQNGVSPVIAVILMVAITVVLAAVLYVMVSEIPHSNLTPRVTMRWNRVSGQPGNYSGSVLEISGGDPPLLEEVSVTVIHEGLSGTETLDDIAVNGMNVGAFNLNFKDNGDNELGGQDMWFITGGSSGDIVRLVYEETSGQMHEDELP